MEYEAFLEREHGAAERETFVCDTEGKALWAMRKWATFRRALDQRVQDYREELDRLERWKAEEDRRDLGELAYFEGLLHGYFDRLRDQGKLGRRKSHRLPLIILQARDGGPEFERNESQLLPWAEAKGLVRKEVAWSEVKRRLKADGDLVVDLTTGELVPGLTVRYRGETFSIRLVEDGSADEGERHD